MCKKNTADAALEIHPYLRGGAMLLRGRIWSVHNIRGGNGFIRSSIACHLICIILLNRRSFHKKCPLTKADNISGLRIPQNWLLHFHRKFNLAIPSRFPGSRIITSSLLLMRKHNGLWDSLLCYSDRIAQVSHLIPSFSQLIAVST